MNTFLATVREPYKRDFAFVWRASPLDDVCAA